MVFITFTPEVCIHSTMQVYPKQELKGEMGGKWGVVGKILRRQARFLGPVDTMPSPWVWAGPMNMMGHHLHN